MTCATAAAKRWPMPDPTQDLVWGEGKPPKELAGESVALLCMNRITGKRSVRVTSWTRRSRGANNSKTCGYFVLPSGDEWWQLFRDSQREELRLNPEENRARSVDDLEGSIRTMVWLQRADIKTMGELADMTRVGALRRGMNRNITEEVSELLAEYGLAFEETEAS